MTRRFSLLDFGRSSPSLHLLALISCPIYHLFSLICLLEWLYYSSHLARRPNPILAADTFLNSINNASPANPTSHPASLFIFWYSWEPQLSLLDFSFIKTRALIAIIDTSNGSSATLALYFLTSIRTLHSTPLPCPVLLSITRTGQHRSTSFPAHICTSEPSSQDDNAHFFLSFKTSSHHCITTAFLIPSALFFLHLLRERIDLLGTQHV